VLLLSEGQMSDHKGAALILPGLLTACELLGDRGYDSNWFRAVLPPELPRQASDPSHSARQSVHEHLHQRDIDGVDEANSRRVNSFSAVARYPADLQRW